MSGDSTDWRTRLNRRNFLAAGSAAALGLAGCTGGGGGGDTPTARVETRIVEQEGETVVKTVRTTPSGGAMDGEMAEFAEQINFGNNLRARRLEGAQDWAMEDRRDVPSRDEDTWTGTRSFETAPWEPPEGWEDTIAGEVDELQILNHGAVNMEFDPATLATHELFEKKTGIEITPIELASDRAHIKEQQLLNSKQTTPHAMTIDGSVLPPIIQPGYLEPVDALYPSESVWDDYIPALRSLTEWTLDTTRSGAHIYGYPNIVEGAVGHLRPDLVEEQGIDPARFDGEWSWDLLEETMAAFEGTDKFGYAFYAGSPVYLGYAFRGLLYQQGGRIVQDDGTVLFDQPMGVEVLNRMNKWYENEWVPGDVLSYSEGDLLDVYLSGKIAYADAFSDFIPQSLGQFEADTQYRPVLPPKATTGENPTQAALVDPNCTGINTHSEPKYKAAAMLYGDARLSYASQWWEYTYEGNMSYLKQVYDDAAGEGITPYASVIGASISRGVFEVFPQMQPILQRMVTPFQNAITGQTAPEDALAELQGYIDSILSQ